MRRKLLLYAPKSDRRVHPKKMSRIMTEPPGYRSAHHQLVARKADPGTVEG
jgi:hypothetical protein